MGIWEDFFERAKSIFGTTNPLNMGVFEEFFEKAKTLFGESESGAAAPKKRCYYELLEVDRDATEDEIKKSYKKLALKWHPDKNPEKQEECAAYFVLLQQAYEVLVDPQERAFYDKHRENILHGGESAEESRDEGISLYPYFSTCYKGFNDEKEGFYAVYRELFDKLSAEEYAYLDEDERDFPSFGKSDSDYEKIVYKFYAFWMDFHTSRSFAWLDKYDLRQAPDRRTLRAMEKENEKLREVGRKKRNEEIQELVMYVRKRDPRVKRYRETLEKRRQEQLQRVEQIRRQQLKENLEKLGEYVVDEDAHQAHLEALDEIENALDAEFGTIGQKVAAAGSDVSDEEDEEENYCVACEKAFKSSKAYSNHQKSKKHKQTVEELKKFMKEEDAVLILGDEPSNFNDVVDEEIQQVSSKSKKKRKKQRENANGTVEDTKENENEPNLVEEMEKVEIKEAAEQGEKPTKKEKRKMKQKEVAAPSSSQPVLPVKPTGPVESKCDHCNETFDSRSKLFKHLELTGHATLKSAIGNSSGNKSKKGKK